MKTLIVTNCRDSFDVMDVCASCPEAENVVREYLAETGEEDEVETVFATEHNECNRDVLVAAESYLRDVISRQSQQNASVINADAEEHLANVRDALRCPEVSL